MVSWAGVPREGIPVIANAFGGTAGLHTRRRDGVAQPFVLGCRAGAHHARDH